MKKQYGILFLAFLLSTLSVRGQEEKISVLDKKISLTVREETVYSILEQITGKLHVFFSYDATLIEPDNRTSLDIKDKSIKEILDFLFDSKFIYQVIGDQIIISKPDTDDAQKDIGKGKILALIIFRGKITDARENTNLPYASISVIGRNIGTISNTDGEFELKIPENMQQDSILISCLGYRQNKIVVSKVEKNSMQVRLEPVSIQLKEVRVTVINAESIIEKVISKIPLNYPVEPEIMTAFYREVLKQDGEYIDVAEALMEIRKAPYNNEFVEDKIKFLKGRKNLNVKPFSMVDFKMQGGPYYATKLDIIKTLESFFDPDYRDSYKYILDEIIDFNDHNTYVIRFKPAEKFENLSYQGKLYVDMSTLALVQADFSLSRQGLKYAHQSLIKKKPKDFYVRPVNADYSVSFRKANNKWHLNNVQTSVSFKVKSKSDQVNSTFHSDSELLITGIRPEEDDRFKRNELFNQNDIFSEMITSYDENFWKDYNIIKPSEELRNALKNYYEKNDSLFQYKGKADRRSKRK